MFPKVLKIKSKVEFTRKSTLLAHWIEVQLHLSPDPKRLGLNPKPILASQRSMSIERDAYDVVLSLHYLPYSWWEVGP